MLRHAVGVALLVSMVTCQPSWKTDMMMMNGTTPENILQQYRNASQAQAADTNRDGQIDANEFAQSLYSQADANNDGNVDQAEFMDSYRQRLPFLPSEVLAVMFNLLDDLNPDPGVDMPANYTPTCNPNLNIFSNVVDFGDDVLKAEDVSIQSFTQSNTPSVDDFQKALNTWVGEAARRVHKYKTTPFVVGKPYDVDYDYDLFFSHLDANNDDIITTAELGDLLTKYTSSGTVNRADWVARNVETYGQNRVVAHVIFDYLDANNDLVINAEDVREILMWADVNRDERTTKQEMYRFMQRKDKSVRRMLGLPIKPFVYDCPDPMWKDEVNCDAALDATLLTMDTDYNFDGNVTAMEMKQQIMLMDKNMDAKVDRVEYVRFFKERYDQDMSAADLDFDSIDMNGDGFYTWEDYENQFKDQMAWMCVCEFRLSVLASARASEYLAKERKMRMQLTRMKYFVLLHQGLQNVQFPRPASSVGPVAQWRWKTMNGRPAMGGCKKCNARENWGMKDDRVVDDGYNLVDVHEWKMMYMLVAAMKKLNMMQQTNKAEGDWKAMKMMMLAMHMLKMETTGNTNDDGVNEMAKWMTWKMATMKMEKLQERMDGTGSSGSGIWKVTSEGGWKMWNDSKGTEERKDQWPKWMEWQKEGKTDEMGWPKWTEWQKETEKKEMSWPKWTEWQKETEKKEMSWPKWTEWQKATEEKTQVEWPKWLDWQTKGQEDKQKKGPFDKFLEWHEQMQKEMKGKKEEQQAESDWDKVMKWREEMLRKEMEDRQASENKAAAKGSEWQKFMNWYEMQKKGGMMADKESFWDRFVKWQKEQQQKEMQWPKWAEWQPDWPKLKQWGP